jgi:hypothetical protein
LKALYGAILAGLGALQVALNPIADGPAEVTMSEWVGVAVATVVTFGVVWGVPNKPAA